jgi:polyphosphate kinase
VEVLVPVLDGGLAAALRVRLLGLQLRDTVRAMELAPDGAYRRLPGGASRLDAQLAWTDPDMTFMA